MNDIYVSYSSHLNEQLDERTYLSRHFGNHKGYDSILNTIKKIVTLDTQYSDRKEILNQLTREDMENIFSIRVHIEGLSRKDFLNDERVNIYFLTLFNEIYLR
jgi:hypothetical protein